MDMQRTAMVFGVSGLLALAGGLAGCGSSSTVSDSEADSVSFDEDWAATFEDSDEYSDGSSEDRESEWSDEWMAQDYANGEDWDENDTERTSNDSVSPFDSSFVPLASSTTETGLVIDEIKLGDGEACGPFNTVVVNYQGFFADGFVFDTTEDSESQHFPLAQLIDGWQEGLAGMCTGGVRRLTIPAHLAYGDQGWDVLGIPAGAELTFVVELVGIE